MDRSTQYVERRIFLCMYKRSMDIEIEGRQKAFSRVKNSKTMLSRNHVSDIISHAIIVVVHD